MQRSAEQISDAEFCRYWGKLKLDITELDVDESEFNPQNKLPGRLDIKLSHITTNQQKICIDFIY